MTFTTKKDIHYYLPLLSHHDVLRMSVADAQDERRHAVAGTGSREGVNRLLIPAQ
jgi:hypothetical protein